MAKSSGEASSPETGVLTVRVPKTTLDNLKSLASKASLNLNALVAGYLVWALDKPDHGWQQYVDDLRLVIQDPKDDQPLLEWTSEDVKLKDEACQRLQAAGLIEKYRYQPGSFGYIASFNLTIPGRFVVNAFLNE